MKIVARDDIKLGFLLSAALLIPAMTYAEDASFACNKATSRVELRICNSPYATLKELDRDLANWYKRALSITQDANLLRADQRQWLLSLDNCLTSETVEPHPYVCNHWHNSNENTQCLRDFCLVGKYIERTKFLNSLTTQGVAGRYILSNIWPNGIHENMDRMAPEDKKFCKSVEAALWSLGPLSRPLTDQQPISKALTQASVSWVTIEKPELLLNAKKLEKILRNTWNHSADIVDSKEFSQLLRDRIESGELTISLGTTPTFVKARVESENKDTEVLRYQRWGNVEKTTNLDHYSKIEYFRVDNGDLSTAQPITFSEDKDAFKFDRKLYFDLVSERSHDDNWNSLPNPQPDLYIYQAYWYDSAHTQLKTICHLLFEQRVAK